MSTNFIFIYKLKKFFGTLAMLLNYNQSLIPH